MVRPFVWAIALLAGVLSLASSPAHARGKTDQVRVEYEAVKNPEHANLRQRLMDAHVLEKIRHMLSPFRLPQTLTLKLVGCDGARNAWYEDGVVSVCYDYIAFIADNSTKVPPELGLSPRAALIGATLDIFLHEFGHAAFDLLDIPIFGREEDAADMFSAYIMLRFDPADARKLILATAFLSASEARTDQKPKPDLKDFANEHGLPVQRYFNLLCMAYGSDAKTFADLLTVGKLPQQRADGCSDEFEQVQSAFRKLIRPHVDQALLKKVKATRRIDF